MGKMLEVWKVAPLSKVPDTPPLQDIAQIELEDEGLPGYVALVQARVGGHDLFRKLPHVLHETFL